jgi:hypothetical protein
MPNLRETSAVDKPESTVNAIIEKNIAYYVFNGVGLGSRSGNRN